MNTTGVDWLEGAEIDGKKTDSERCKCRSDDSEK